MSFPEIISEDSTGLFVLVLLLVALVAAGIIFLVPIPYTATIHYTEIEPYVGTERYSESVPYTIEQCKLDFSLHPEDYIVRGLDAYLSGKNVIEDP